MCLSYSVDSVFFFFFFNDTATTEIYTLSTRRSSDLRSAAVVDCRLWLAEPDFTCELCSRGSSPGPSVQKKCGSACDHAPSRGERSIFIGFFRGWILN